MISSNSKWIKNVSVNWLKTHCTTIIKTKQAQAFLLRNHLFQEKFASSKLISFLALSESGNLNYAHRIFNQIENPDMFIWNTMIRGYSRSPYPFESISLYNLMIQSGVVPDNFTCTFALTACARLQEIKFGRRVHCVIVKIGFQLDVFVLNSLIQMYGNCGSFDDARTLFDEIPVRDVVTWNVIIGAHVNGGFYQEAFDLFKKMRETDNIEPDEVTILSMVSACTQSGNLEQGLILHSYSNEVGFEKNIHLCNAIIDMYCKCGDLGSAQILFESMIKRDILTWTSMISGLANSGYFRESLVLFGQMQFEKIKPDEVILVSVLSACAQIGALDQGKYIHLLMLRYKVKQDVVLETALVDMYAKCGSMDLGLQVFNKMKTKNVFTWNTIIGGLAMNGQGLDALMFFDQMKSEGIMPDDVTFIGLLCACGHTGLVDTGLEIFRSMKEVYDIQPRIEHYGCMVDLFCRAKLVEDALAFIENMPIRANEVVWATLLLGLSRIGIGEHFELAEKVGKRVIELEPDSCGRYVLLSNLYAGKNQWDDSLRIRKEMKSRGIEKIPGYSWIEVNGLVHQFIAGDRSHVQTDEIYMMMEEMRRRVKLAGGHVSGTAEVLFDIEEEEKENSLYFHSEKLAIALGLISTTPGSLIRIVKNLRVCNDCHSFIKVLSQVFNRHIIARDRSRFHHFSQGSCSCMDFW
ncbi:Pentatricopeptide repeat [Macleaya cordata]|uniref:Pentatricopeptide repeat n=1 Tax=Macleaya cordata TaxID=56857 RepID=A0A200RAU8_MACCD|nr:Pentatricopeptide repeat [Macleaya cordata]